MAPKRHRPTSVTTLFALCTPAVILSLVTLLYDPRTTVFGAAKTVGLAGGALWMLMGLSWCYGRRKQPFCADWITACVMVLLGWGALSLLWTPSPASGLHDLALFFCAAVLLLSVRALPTVDRSTANGALFFAGGATLTYLALFLIAAVQKRIYGKVPVATIGNPNHLAAYVAAVAPLAIWTGHRLLAPKGQPAPGDEPGPAPASPQAARRLARRGRLAALSAIWMAVLGSAALIFYWTGCRSALLGLAVGGPLAAFIGTRSRLIRTLRLAAACLLALLVVVAAWKGGSGWSGRLRGRTYLARLTARIWCAAPWAGHGLGSFAHRFASAQARHLKSHTRDRKYWTNAQKPHTEPLAVLAELGLGGVGVLFLLGFLLIRGSRTRAPHPQHRATRNAFCDPTVCPRSPPAAAAQTNGWSPPLGFRRAALAALTALLVTSLAEATFHVPSLLCLSALVLGLLNPIPPLSPPPRKQSTVSQDGLHDKNGATEPASIIRRLSARLAQIRAKLAARCSAPVDKLLCGHIVLIVLAAGSATALYLFAQHYRAERFLGRARALAHPTARKRIALLHQAQTLALNPGRARFYLGLALLDAEHPRRALYWLQRSRRDFANLSTHIAEGNAHMKLQQYPRAARAFRRATWLNPRFGAAHYSLALALRRLGRHTEAQKSLLRAHRLWPARWPRHFKQRRLTR